MDEEFAIVPIEKIYDNSESHHVAAYVVYGLNGEVFANPKCTQGIDFEELRAAFMTSRVLVVEEDGILVAVGITGNELVGPNDLVWVAGESGEK